MARRRCLERDNYHCRDCQRAAGRFEIHHVIPLAAGGSALDVDNLLSLCRDCHHARHRDESPEVVAWTAFVGELREASTPELK